MKKIFSILCFVLISMSCTNDDFADVTDELNFTAAEDQRSVIAGLIINKEVFDGLEINRKKGISKGANFDFKSVKRVNNVLELELSFSGGCETHTIDIVWDGVIYTDNPCKMNLIVVHNSNNDKCEALITKTFYINLKDLVGDIDYKDICEYHLFSTFNTSENPNIKTSN